jgi:hypothetical protein
MSHQKSHMSHGGRPLAAPRTMIVHGYAHSWRLFGAPSDIEELVDRVHAHSEATSM